MKDIITRIGPDHLGQPIGSANGIREFSDDEYANAEASGMRRTLRDEKLFNGPERLDLVAIPWEGTIIASTEGKIYKICLQFNTRNDRFAKIAKRAITAVLNGLEFGYLYNGILQHSDASLSRRFLTDYASGELNYLLWKHVRVLGFIKSLLRPYHRMMSVLTLPTLGAL